MLKRAFRVQVELDVQAVTCPGVWLCPNGKVSLQIYMLGCCVQTSSVEPTFPMFFQEKFVCCKAFFSVGKLIGLHKILSKEIVYAELVQWKNCEIGNVLATFQTSLAELLFPVQRDGITGGNDIDLLMEPMKTFPGILSPKIEVSTKLVIEDKLCSTDEAEQSFVINPKVICSKQTQSTSVSRQRKVCHSAKYHRSNNCTSHCRNHDGRPLFAYRRIDDNLINRKVKNIEDASDSEYCKCRSSPVKKALPTINVNRKSEKVLQRSPLRSTTCLKKEEECGCNDIHTKDGCPVCSKYKYYFDSKAPSIKSRKSSSPPRDLRKRQENCWCEKPKSNLKLCNYSPKVERVSLAQRLHNRLQRCLENRPSITSCANRYENYLSDWECVCSLPSDNCTVSSFGDFYKNLYRRTRDKCQAYVNCT